LQSGSTKFSPQSSIKSSHQEGQMSTLQSGRIDVNLAKSQKLKKKKPSSEKLDQTLSSIRKVRRTLPLENSQRKKERKKQV